ncbi:hypothetical protein L1987_47044 [Smallanthus sonchifolius]|uniref:Uncharacterized protein n=1 Tax=Smallanthus sonchifolius TaxID=185202 RepID=A0ACB9G202_9ASTR|nr:hypothetical protein L1987_47044 [Smallanthus sonchifolius]
MSISIHSFAFSMILPLQKENKARSRLDIKAQSVQDEGRSSNLVDSNMKLFKDRIEVMRTKERLEQNHRPCGWVYMSKYINQRPKKQPEYLQTITLICGTYGASIIIGIGILCILSIIVHLKI